MQAAMTAGSAEITGRKQLLKRAFAGSYLELANDLHACSVMLSFSTHIE